MAKARGKIAAERRAACSPGVSSEFHGEMAARVAAAMTVEASRHIKWSNRFARDRFTSELYPIVLTALRDQDAEPTAYLRRYIEKLFGWRDEP